MKIENLKLVGGQDVLDYIHNYFVILSDDEDFQPELFEEDEYGNTVNILRVPIVLQKFNKQECTAHSIFYDYDDNTIFTDASVEVVTNCSDSIGKLLQKLKDNFKTSEYERYYLKISPSDGSDIDNYFFVRLIKFIIDSIDPKDNDLSSLLRNKKNK